jgi:hypothetical protein
MSVRIFDSHVFFCCDIRLFVAAWLRACLCGGLSVFVQRRPAFTIPLYCCNLSRACFPINLARRYMMYLHETKTLRPVLVWRLCGIQRSGPHQRSCSEVACLGWCLLIHLDPPAVPYPYACTAVGDRHSHVTAECMRAWRLSVVPRSLSENGTKPRRYTQRFASRYTLALDSNYASLMMAICLARNLRVVAISIFAARAQPPMKQI